MSSAPELPSASVSPSPPGTPPVVQPVFPPPPRPTRTHRHREALDADVRPDLLGRRSWGTSSVVHAVLVVGILALIPSAAPPPQEVAIRASLAAEPLDEVALEYECACEDVVCEEVVGVVHDGDGGPWIGPEPSTDEEVCFEESYGETAGLGDGHLEGPAANGLVGIGGGAGGAFRGRGGGVGVRIGMDGGASGSFCRGGCGSGGGSGGGFNREGYDHIAESPFRRTAVDHTSTFSIDVDTASYANVRRILGEGRLPPPDAVRIEEFLNYFTYDYSAPGPEDRHPFWTDVEIAPCPWCPRHRLARIALQGRVIERSERPACNLVFLVDVSGSMDSPAKLPLLKQVLGRLTDELDARDRVAIVVYAGAAGLVLPATPGDDRAAIQGALEQLQAGGSTNGGAGIELAYRIARAERIEGGVNRVVLATDGDFNVGVSDRGSLVRLVRQEAASGVYLSVLGFGTGNLRDGQLEAISNEGNGNYAYIDSAREGQKVLVEQMGGTFVTIAKDVKIQVFFNPRMVAGHRLIGYENRRLARQDFNDDRKDAGDIGAGHSVTALYELVPAGLEVPGAPPVDDNPFVERPLPLGTSDALLRLRLRYKAPDGEQSTLLEEDMHEARQHLGQTDPDFRWAAAVAAFAMTLRDSPHRGTASFELAAELGDRALGADPGGLRAEMLDLVSQARRLGNE